MTLSLEMTLIKSKFSASKALHGDTQFRVASIFTQSFHQEYYGMRFNNN